MKEVAILISVYLVSLSTIIFCIRYLRKIAKQPKPKTVLQEFITPKSIFPEITIAQPHPENGRSFNQNKLNPTTHFLGTDRTQITPKKDIQILSASTPQTESSTIIRSKPYPPRDNEANPSFSTSHSRTKQVAIEPNSFASSCQIKPTDTSTFLSKTANLSSKPSASRWQISPEEIFKKNYVSYSRLNTFKNCNKHFELAYLCGLPDPAGSAAYHGSVVHKMLELYSKDQVISNSKQEFESLQVKEIMQYKEKAIEEEDNMYPINETDLIANIRNFISINKGRDISDILETEQTVLNSVAGYMVKGIIDRVDSGYPKTIIDYKTGKKQYVSKHQLNLYALALLNDKYEPCSLEFQFLKTGETMSWSFTQKEAERTRTWMLDTITTIESKTYFERNTRLCNWCGVRKYCYGTKA